MSHKFYIEKDNGDLKYVNEVEDAESVELAFDALLEATPKLFGQELVVLDDDTVRVIADEEAPIQPRHKITVRGGASNDEDEAPAPKRRGRPPGSKNKAASAEEDDAPAPRRRGRPPGSKNKTTTTKAASGDAPKRRGRPPGSKNKPKAVEDAPAPKRRGRPPGSKNKTSVKAAPVAAKRTIRRRAVSANSSD